MGRQSSTRGVKVGSQQLSCVDAVPDPLGLNVNTSRDTLARSQTLRSVSCSSLLILDRHSRKRQVRSVNNLVSDATIGLVGSVGALAQNSVPCYALATEGTENELERVT